MSDNTSIPPAAPSTKMADSLVRAVARVQAAEAGGDTDLAASSDGLVHVRADGAVEVAIHAVLITGATELSELRALGVEPARTTTTPAVPGSPPATVIEAWVPANRLAALAGLAWVGAITAPSYGQGGG